ncbi:hydrolase Nlp/P60 [Alphaproteobacteria bacterium]|nr:hydrolase Nlp/P60 [Alphaproteobacteria bacterium]
MKNVCAILLFIALSACSGDRRLCVVDENLDAMLARDVPQDASILASSAEYSAKILTKSQQNMLDEKFNKIFFSPWTDEVILPEARELFIPDGHGENLHRWSFQERKKIRDNIRAQAYPSVKIKAIAIRNTMSYISPTEKPFFENIKLPGGSYPFNENIQSMIYLGMPLLITHISADKAWFYVSCYMFSGWVKADDIAYVDESFIKSYMQNQLFISIDDDVQLVSDNCLVSVAHMGAILAGAEKGLIVPHMIENGYAGIEVCQSDSFVKKPYAFTGEHIIEITKKLLGTKYGWGGYLNNRDCSSMTHDFMAIFGIFIPRNGNAQLTMSGYKSLKNVWNRSDFIKKNGIPFLTLVGEKGHVMLYVGTYEEKSIFLNNMWSIKRGEHRDGRYVIGKTILNTLGFGDKVENSEIMNERAHLMRNVIPNPSSK